MYSGARLPSHGATKHRRTRASGPSIAIRTSWRRAATWQRSRRRAASPSRSPPTRTWRPGGRSSTPTRLSTPSCARSCPAPSRSGRSRSTSTSSKGSPSRSWTPRSPGRCWAAMGSTSSTRSPRRSRSGSWPASWACPRPAWTRSSTWATGSSPTPTRTSPTWSGAATTPTPTGGSRSAAPTASNYGTWAGRSWPTGSVIPATTCCPGCCVPRWTATGSARPTSTTSSPSW